MTCIAVVRQENKIYMAGDRGVSDDNTINVCSSPRYGKKKDIYLDMLDLWMGIE